jgi:hypothetical protein
LNSIERYPFETSLDKINPSLKSQAKVFEISPHPSPLPNGERGRVRGQILIWLLIIIWNL